MAGLETPVPANEPIENGSLKFEINTAAAAGRCWFAKGLVYGESLDWLVDTGASPNVIDIDVFNAIPDSLRPKLQYTNTSFQSADGGTMSVYGEADLLVTFGNTPVILKVVVAQLGSLQAIVGIQFLEENKCIFDLENGYVFSPNLEIKLFKTPMCDSQGCSTLRLQETISLPPGHEMVAMATTDIRYWSDLEPVGLIEPTPDLGNIGLLIPRSVVRVRPQIAVILTNPTDKSIGLQFGSTVGNLVSANIMSNGTVHTVSPKPDASENLPEHLQPLSDNVSESLTSDQKQQVEDLLAKFQTGFVGPDGKLGRTNLVKHRIDTGDSPPIKQPFRRLPIAQREIVEKELEKMLENDVIEPSESPWSSPLVLVKKKDGSVRTCIDLRRANMASRKDAYPLPNIADCLDSLGGNRYFSTLDLASGYWQVELEEDAKPVTAFSTHKGLYQFKVLPFGLCNAPATFERLMELVLRGLQWEKCLVYLDDIICFGDSFDHAMENLTMVIEKLVQAGLKLKPSKCCLFQDKVQFLGHVVSPAGILCDPEKIAIVENWPVPKSLTEVRSFVGLASYYRRFIPCFAELANPLTNLTRKNVPFLWDENCQLAFNALKDRLVTAPVLAYPSLHPDHQFILDTDASDTGLGAVLSQLIDGEEKVVAYASKTLSPSQRRYCTTYRELLAVVVFTQHFKHYLLGRCFKLRTDHNSLRWLHNFKNIEGMVGRWIAALGSFNYSIEHRKGDQHGNADALSRVKPLSKRLRCGREVCPECPDGIEITPKHVRQAIASEPELEEAPIYVMTRRQNQLAQADDSSASSSSEYEDDDSSCSESESENTDSSDSDNSDAESEPNPTALVPDSDSTIDDEPVLISNWVQSWTEQDLAKWQREDKILSQVIYWLENECKPKQSELMGQPVELRTMCAIAKSLRLKRGVLYRKWRYKKKHKRTRICIVAPDSVREDLFQHLHTHKTGGHLGITKTLAKVKRRFFWPLCKKDVQRWCSSCEMCARVKSGPRNRAQLHQIPVGAPLDRLALDIVGPLPATERNNVYILVVSDYFTKWVEAYALPDQTAYTVAEVLFNEFISRFGVPRQIHSDQGRNFESTLFSELCKLLEVSKTRTTPYRPQSDGLVERFNRTLQQMLKTLVNEARDDWDELLPYVTMAYRASPQESTGCSPNLLMLGRESNLPLDVVVGCPTALEREYECSTEYVEWLRKTLSHVHEFARTQLKTAAQRQKANYDRKTRSTKIEPGQFVWRYYPPSANQKLGKGWVGPYKVVSCPTDIHCDIVLNPGAKPVRVHTDQLKLNSGSVPSQWVTTADSEGSPSESTRSVTPSGERAESTRSSNSESQSFNSENSRGHDPGTRPLTSDPGETSSVSVRRNPITTRSRTIRAPRRLDL